MRRRALLITFNVEVFEPAPGGKVTSIAGVETRTVPHRTHIPKVMCEPPTLRCTRFIPRMRELVAGSRLTQSHH